MNFLKYISKVLIWILLASLISWHLGILKISDQKFSGGIKLRPVFSLNNIENSDNLYSNQIMVKYRDLEVDIKAAISPQAAAINPDIWSRTIFTLKSDTQNSKNDRFILFSIPLTKEDDRSQAQKIASLIQSYLQSNKDQIEKRLSQFNESHL